MKKDYESEAKKLAKVIDIPVDCFTKYPPREFNRENIDHIVKVYSEWKISVLNPEPKFKKIASLKYHIQDVFTYFQEGSGETVEHFWLQLAKENLGYVREDKLSKVIARGKIKDRIEYEMVTDSMVATMQEKRISQAEAEQLSKMLGKFELHSEKKK